MNKHIIFLSLAAALTGCTTGAYEDWASPQASEEEAAKEINLTVAPAPTVDFSTVTADSVALFVPTVKSTFNVTEQSYTATLSNADGSQKVTLNASADGKVKASELQAAVTSLFGLKDDLRTMSTLVKGTIKGENLGFVRTATINTTAKLVKPQFNEVYYLIGGGDWNTPRTLNGPNMDGTYEGYYYLSDAFKFRPNVDNWDNNFGGNGAGKLVANGDNITIPANGFYKLNIDLGASTYSIQQVTNLSVVGDAALGWPGDDTSNDVELTYNTETKAWEGTVALKASGAFKIRMNHAWDISWGGKANGTDYNNLTANNGQNLKVAADGTYKVQFFLTYEGNNKIVLTKQ